MSTIGCVTSGAPSSTAETPNTKTEVSNISNTFEMKLINKQKIDANTAFYFYKEKRYRCYLCTLYAKIGYAGGGGLTAMSDPETGLPLTYARYIEIYSNKVEVKE